MWRYVRVICPMARVRMKISYGIYATLAFIVLLCFILYQTDNTINVPIINNMIVIEKKSTHKNMKYILIWTRSDVEPITKLGKAQEAFIEKECPIKSCFVTSDRQFLSDVTEFEAIIFHGLEIMQRLPKMPHLRSTHQKYIFASMESSDYYPVCDVRYEGFFNSTWTYKLNSDINNRYIAIKNKDGSIIGPKQEMNWLKIEDMDPVSEELENMLSRKTKLAAWFVSNCKAPSGRDNFVYEVQKQLQKYGFSIDIYGDCGDKLCPRDDERKCFKLIKRDYFFYFALENSFSEDYVTEKLLHALQNYAIPVVYGAANYSRFMPDGIYLNARNLGAKELARQMVEIYKDEKKYLSFFKWRNHYSYHDVFESWETDTICNFCAIMNDETFLQKHTVHKHFKSWWNPPGRC